ncbi:hypothetical protein NNJEOMEG_03629 [Fundidesulfovibrio magnetotacticus]|uniref:Uncharacterized protein n=1 Tax=Fundidesulfovibrio magnetotacticus TaxID=2730080 RepID=A0A6V8LYU7_9BACT|nr:hypothetical protein [Fundidesulfovibrio magnetotacticus]GFK95761.1 hypothetical protein NNJEOMEG_03629 [Fundidesulfovibrio magnetotacticus]
MRLFPAAALALLNILALALACGPVRAMPKNDIQLVQSARFPFDTTLTVKQAMERYFYFSNITWSVSYDVTGRKVVEARGYFDMAKVRTRTDPSTCVNRAGVSVGLNPGQPFMVLQYRPDFLGQTAQLFYSGLWELHDEARLDDPDLLWAKALVTDELPSPVPLCDMPLDQISPLDQLAIQEAPVVDPGAPAADPAAEAKTQTPQGTPRVSPDATKSPLPPAVQPASDVAKKAKETPPTPTSTGR